MGRLVKTPAHLIDIMATCVDLSGASYPKEHSGHPIQPMEGQSLKPLLVTPSPSLPVSLSDRPLFWEHEGNRAIRIGDWKLVSKHPGGWELYDMTTDRTEMNNVAAEQPDRVKEMSVQWDAWAKRVGVAPWPLGGEKKGKGKKK